MNYRLVHLATHGQANPSRPEETALILARDRLPPADEQERRVLAGKKPIDGRLTVGTSMPPVPTKDLGTTAGG